MTTVKATNNFNKSFGIEKGNIYQAVKNETVYQIKIDEWTTEDYTDVTYTINGMNFQSDDFVEVN